MCINNRIFPLFPETAQFSHACRSGTNIAYYIGKALNLKEAGAALPPPPPFFTRRRCRTPSTRFFPESLIRKVQLPVLMAGCLCPGILANSAIQDTSPISDDRRWALRSRRRACFSRRFCFLARSLLVFSNEARDRCGIHGLLSVKNPFIPAVRIREVRN